jgi:hypothetical protein
MDCTGSSCLLTPREGSGGSNEGWIDIEGNWIAESASKAGHWPLGRHQERLAPSAELQKASAVATPSFQHLFCEQHRNTHSPQDNHNQAQVDPPW